MRKLKLPKLIENNKLPKKMPQKEFEEMLKDNWVELVPHFAFNVEGLNLHIAFDRDDNSGYLYAYICGGGAKYYDYAIVKTDDPHFKTYAEYKRAVKILSKQLAQRYRQWVDNFYE